MSKRKEVTDFIVKSVDTIIPGYKTNGELIRTMLDAMPLSEFEAYIKGFRRPADAPPDQVRSILPYYLPLLSKHRINIKHLFKIHDQIGRPAKQRLIMSDPVTGLEYLTPHEYPIVVLPLRRQSQTMYNKSSIPEGRHPIDDTTPQPVSTSKGSSITQPEIGSLAGRNLDDVLFEFLNVRAGNEVARREFRKQLIDSGSGSLQSVSGLGSIKSINTLSVYLNGMCLGNNADPKTKVPEDELRRIKQKNS